MSDHAKKLLIVGVVFFIWVMTLSVWAKGLWEAMHNLQLNTWGAWSNGVMSCFLVLTIKDFLTHGRNK